MKYDHLKTIPIKERQRMLTPDWNMKYFQGYYLLSAITIVSVSILNGVLAVVYNCGLFEVIFCNVIGIPVAIVAHLSLSSGFISTNTGSYFRETEPIRYWFTMCFPIGGYILSQVALWHI